jgi:hypothetical protein
MYNWFVLLFSVKALVTVNDKVADVVVPVATLVS